MVNLRNIYGGVMKKILVSFMVIAVMGFMVGMR